MHELNLKYDSTYALRLFCEGDSTSNLKPEFQGGKWSLANDSVIIFNPIHEASFRGKILYTGSIQLYNDKGNVMYDEFNRNLHQDKQ